MAFCTKCGCRLENYERFCNSCGSPAAGKCEEVYLNEEVHLERSYEDVLLREGSRNAFKSVPLISMKKSTLKLKHLVISILLIAALISGYLLLTKKHIVMYGNSSDNIVNGGFSVIQDNWIYYTYNNGLYKMDSKSGQSKKIADGRFSSLNIKDDWIYCNYYFDTYTNSAYKLKTDGTSLTKLQDGYFLFVVDDSYYYTDNNKSFTEVRKDGRKITYTLASGEYLLKITDSKYYLMKEQTINVAEGRINVSISEIDKESGEKKIVFTEDLDRSMYGGGSFHMENDYIYYRNGGALYKYDMKNEIRTKLADVAFTGFDAFNVSGDWIYIQENVGSLCKLKTDGSQDIKIADIGQNLRQINVVGDWIFVVGTTDLIRVKTDGSMKENLGTYFPDQVFGSANSNGEHYIDEK